MPGHASWNEIDNFTAVSLKMSKTSKQNARDPVVSLTVLFIGMHNKKNYFGSRSPPTPCEEVIDEEQRAEIRRERKLRREEMERERRKAVRAAKIRQKEAKRKQAFLISVGGPFAGKSPISTLKFVVFPVEKPKFILLFDIANYSGKEVL